MIKRKSITILISCIILAITAMMTQHTYAGTGRFDGRLLASVLITGSLMTIFFTLYIQRSYSRAGLEHGQVRALFEHATEGIILTNDKGKIILLNPAASNLFGYPQEELLGQSIEMLIPARYHDGHFRYREGFSDHPSNRIMGQGRDLFAKKKDGHEFAVEVSLSHYRKKDDLYVIAFLVDITQRKLAEQELRERKTQLEKITKDITRLNAELEIKVEQRTLILREALKELENSQTELSEALSKEKELNEIKSRFVSIASHEFRTPLSTVLSSASLLSKYTGAEDQDKRDKHIKKIRDSVKYLNDLLEDLLSLDRLEEGRIPVTMTAFPIGELLEEIIDEIRSDARPGQDIQYDLLPAGSFVGDRRLIKNIVINLLSNAVKFSPEASPILLQVRLSPEKRLSLTVMDRGIGVSAEDQQHLFSSFFRAGNAMNIDGTGLGLHLVKRYIDLMDGRIFFQSTLDQGTTVSIEIPQGNLPA